MDPSEDTSGTLRVSDRHDAGAPDLELKFEVQFQTESFLMDKTLVF